MQEETLKTIFEGMEMLNEETREEISQVFSKTLAEAKVEQEKAIRAELAERYESDKKAIHAALELFLEQELSSAVADLQNGINEVDSLKKQYAEKTVTVKEQAKKYVADRLSAIEKVIEGVLKKELTELHESEKQSRRAYVRALTEAKEAQKSDYQKFRAKGAAALEHVVNVMVQGTLDELREDIQVARQADFGREMFETFYTTFRRQFFDSNKEFRAITAELKEAKQTAAKAKKLAESKVQEAEGRVRAAEAKSQKIQESVVRSRTISKMLSGLSGQTREQMKHLLEAAKTKDLKQTYRKFLPELLAESQKNRPVKKNRKLDETVIELRTGGKEQIVESNNSDDDEIQTIVRLSGINE